MVRRGDTRAHELVEHALVRIDALNGWLNAFVAVDPEAALHAADAIDQAIADGRDPGPLAGVPLAVKDVEDARGYRTTFGSAVLADSRAAESDSQLVARLVAAGCVVVGKTNVPEFGLRATTDNPTFGVSGNPWDERRSCGGSSGGSAAAVAAGLVPLATGSDGGGSLRIPSALCGLTGFKPSPGQVPSSEAGAPGWPLISTRGVLTRRARDLTAVLGLVRGPAELDLRSLPLDGVSWGSAEPRPPRRVLWSSGLGYASVDTEIDGICRAAVARLADAGCEVVELERVFEIDPGPVLGTLVQQYTRRTIEPFRGTPAWSRLDPLVVLMSELAAGATGQDMVQAIDACHQLGVQLTRALSGFDALLCPTTCGQTPLADMRHDVKDLLALLAADLPPDAAVDPLVELAGTFGDLSFPLGTVDGFPVADFSRLTQPFNLTASPAGTVCAGFTGDGMPVGLQVVGHRLDDLGVLTSLQWLEQLLGHADRVPPLAAA